MIMHHLSVTQLRTALVGTFVLLSLAGSLALATGKGAPSPAPVAAESSPAFVAAEVLSARPAAASPPAQPREDYLGVILTRTSAEIAPRFEGKLRAVHVRLGDHVAAGAVLAELDAPALRFDLRVAEAELKAAGVDQSRTAVELAEAKERLGRRQSLAADALASGEELAASRYQAQLGAARLDATSAQVEQRRAQVERLRQDNADTRITAPFEGIVATRYVDPGATVRPSTPILRLVSMRDLFVRFAVPEQRIRSMAVGQPVRVRVGESRLDLRGTVDKVAPEIDAASRMVFLEARLELMDPEVAVRSGEMARVSVAEAP
jgi:RND family efflux transporter MFP subunit